MEGNREEMTEKKWFCFVGLREETETLMSKAQGWEEREW